MAENNDSDFQASQADVQGLEEKKGGGGGAIIAIIIILIIIAGVAYFFITKKPGIPGVPKPPELGGVMDILPEKCAMFMQVDLGKFDDQKMKDEIWKALKESSDFDKKVKELQKDSDINLEEDILSWMTGQVTLTFLEVPKSAGSPGEKTDMSQENFIIAIQVKDIEKAREKMKKLLEKEGSAYQKEDYEKTEIWIFQKEDKHCIAFLGEFLLLSSKVEEIKKCVDTAGKKGKSLKENEALNNTLSHLSGRAIMVFYMDASGFMKASQASKAQQGPQFEEMEKYQKAIKGMGFTISFQDGDLVGKGFTAIDKNSDSLIVKGLFAGESTVDVKSAMALIPKDTPLFVIFNMKTFYKIGMEMMKKQPGQSEQIEEGKKQMKEQTGVDIDTDIIDNLTGDMIISFDIVKVMGSLKRRPGRRPQAPPIFLAFKLKDKEKFTGALDKLMDSSGKQLQLKKEKIGEASVYMSPMAGFGTFQDFFIVGLGKATATMKNAIDNNMDESKSLASDPGYQKIKDKLGTKTTGVIMLKLDSVMPFLKQMVGSTAQDEKSQKAAQMIFTMMDNYDTLWSFSEIVDDGIVSEFILMKKKGE